MHAGPLIGSLLVVAVSCAPTEAVAPAGAPAPPRGLMATPALRAEAIDLTWEAPPGTTAYRIYRRAQRPRRPGEKSDASLRERDLALLATVEAPRYRDAAVAARIRYDYRVTALRGASESAPSSLVTVLAQPAANAAPAPYAPPLVTRKGRQGSVVVEPRDPDPADGATFRVSKKPRHGAAQVSAAGLAVYAPEPGFAGSDGFEVTVVDDWGARGATAVAVTVENRPPDPAGATLQAFKNTPAGYLVQPRDPDAGERFAFGVSTPAAHGAVSIDGGGLVTYVPELDYLGADAFAVVVTDGSGAARAAVITVWVANRAPAPVAPPLVTEVDTPGATLIAPQDPDRFETWTFSVVTAPTHGAVTVSTAGLVTFVPATGYVGADFVAVEVVDASGAAGIVAIGVTVAQRHLGAGLNLPLPLAVCADAQTRVLITDVTPPAYASFAPGSDVEFTVTLSYASPVAQAIGVDLGGYGAAVTTVAAGCGTVVVSGTAFAVTAGFWLEPQPNFSQTAVQYQVAGAPAAWAAFSSVVPPAGLLIRSPTYSFDARVAYDLAGDAAAWQSYVAVEPVGGQAGYRAEFYPSVAHLDGLPIRLRGALDCGDAFATFQLHARPASAAALWGYAYLALPAAPPAIRVDNFMTGVPVTNLPVTQLINLRPCQGATGVTFTTSAPWISIAPAAAALAAFADTPISITLDGAQLGVFGEEVTGAVYVWPAEGAAFDPVTIEVSAVKHDVDLTAYTRLNLTGNDDGSTLAPLPWPFPAAGGTFDSVEVTANGTVNLTETPCMNEWRNVLGSFQADAPGRFGCPFLAPLWADLAFLHGYAPLQGYPDVYTRTLSAPEPAFEILFWDLQSRGRFYTHNVVAVRLFPDGRFVYRYPQVRPFGHESVGWWDADGRTGSMHFAGALRDGDELAWEPIP